jgi:glycerate-2-kinase
VGTDGTDGPTKAAGAIVDGSTVSRGRKLGMEAESYLNNNDSFTYFDKLSDLIYTSPTGTNVMDIQIIIIDN